MSRGFFLNYKVCRIGKKPDKSDCVKKDCENCRHWIDKKGWVDCMKCKMKVSCSECAYEKARKANELNR
jgi:hypothetical protein